MIRDRGADRLSGIIMAVFGVAYSLYVVQHYPLGTFRRMGSGMFPLGLGVSLALIGVAIAWLQPERTRRSPDFQPRILVLVLAGVGAFAAIVTFFGVFPAVIACVAIASLAEAPVRPLSVAALSGALCLLAWLIFKLALQLPMAMLRWPF